MQTQIKEIYKRVSEKYNIPLEEVTHVGVSVFTELRKEIRHPSKLIFKLDGLGKFFLGKSKILKNLNYLKENYPDIASKLEERLPEYEQYISERKEAKRIRNEFDKLNISQKEIQESSDSE